MKREKKFIMLLLFVMIIGVSKVKAVCDYGYIYDRENDRCLQISTLSSSDKARLSADCNTAICAGTVNDTGWSYFFSVEKSVPIYGLRATLVNSGGEVVKVRKGEIVFPVSINLWPNNTIRNDIYSIINNFTEYSFRNLSRESRVIDPNYHDSMESLFDLNNDYNEDSDAVNYSSIVNKINNIDDIRLLYEKMIGPRYRRSGTELDSLEYVINNNYYILLEPIFVLYVHYFGEDYFYLGTPYEIANAIKKDESSGYISGNIFSNGAFMCGNGNGGWGGPWYVIDNFLTALHLEENVAGFIGTKSSSATCHLPELLQNYKTGWGKGIIRLSQYKVETHKPTVTVQKYDVDGNCYNQPAYFKAVPVGGNESDYTGKGFKTWCNDDGTSKKVTFEVNPNSDYRLFEYTDSSFNNKVNSEKVKYKLNVNYYFLTSSFTVGTNNLSIKVYNEKKSKTCSEELQEIISACGANKKCQNNKSKIIYDLYALYNKHYRNDYNKLLNFNINSSNELDVTNVACEKITCINDENFVCDGKGSINSATPDESKYSYKIEKRVCYNSSTVNKSDTLMGGYYNADLGAECEINYSFNNYFPNDSVMAGRVLWHNNNIKNLYKGLVSIKITCDGAYNDITENELKNMKLKINQFNGDIFPSIDVDWTTAGENFNDKMIFNYFINPLEYAPKSGSIICDNGSTKGYCYAHWEQTYTLGYNLKKEWYSKPDGVFVEKSKIKNFDGYKYRGTGLPISMDNLPGDNFNATFTISLNNKSRQFVCPYKVENEIIKIPTCIGHECNDSGRLKSKIKSFNFDFRIIDTKNPFPGLNGDGRLVGSNWCSDSRIGKIAYTDNDKEYVVGDVIDNDGIVKDTEFQTNFSKFNIKDNPEADINGDGIIRYSNNCNNEINDQINDYCILYNYLLNHDKNCSGNADENYIIKKYITEANNSESDSSVTPMYSFTLTPNEIQNIRQYNKEHAYNDFNLKYDEASKKYKSIFLDNWIIHGTIVTSKYGSKPITIKMNSNNSSCYNTRYDNNWCSNY